MNAQNVVDAPAGESQSPEPTRSERTYRPVVDIVENAEELQILADMPGVAADHVDIHFEDGALTIHGRVAPRQGKQQKYVVAEYGVGDFHRVFRVNEQIDASKISAAYADGVLTVHLPKSEAAKPRKIAVQRS